MCNGDLALKQYEKRQRYLVSKDLQTSGEDLQIGEPQVCYYGDTVRAVYSDDAEVCERWEGQNELCGEAKAPYPMSRDTWVGLNPPEPFLPSFFSLGAVR